jgi:3,4-dihydroxy 2-butanone 4-phosphate synthase/GTP cyclohydrolase II
VGGVRKLLLVVYFFFSFIYDLMSMHFDSIPDTIADIRKGRMVIVTDDADRENEGDLVMAASKITPTAVNFMAKYGRGLICAPITEERARQLGLQRMVAHNREMHKTDFTVSVDAARGITTGISSRDRATTIELAGLDPSAVVCEILNEDGSMARLPQLFRFKKKHGLKICCIQDLISYRRKREKLVEREQTVSLPTDYGDFELHLYRSTVDERHHLALVKGTIDPTQPTLVRVHSECLTGDVFASKRCDCGSQLHLALGQIEQAGAGILVYMRQEGRGIGLAPKIHAYKLQEQGLDTVQANEKLGFPVDLRDYGLGAQILVDLGVRKIRLLTNNPRKVVGLEGYELEIIEQLPIRSTANPHNAGYLATKKAKLGHLL